MPALDPTAPQTYHGAVAVEIYDGSTNSISLVFEGSFSWSEVGRAVVEARSRGRHLATPVLVETEDNDCSISLKGLVTSFLGASTVHLYEALTFTGNAAAWVPVGAGNAKSFGIRFTALSGDFGGGQQVLDFFPCHNGSRKIDPAGDRGLCTLEAEITAYMNQPQVT